MKTKNGLEIMNPKLTDIHSEEVTNLYCNKCGIKICRCGICGEPFFDNKIYCDVQGEIDNETGKDFHVLCYNVEKKKLDQLDWGHGYEF